MQEKDITIKLAKLSDVERMVDHDLRHMKEPGFNGMPAHPFLPSHQFKKEEFLERSLIAFEIPVGKTGWARSFIALDGEKVIGHINIKNQLETILHRARLGMGIEINYRGNGLGSQLLLEAITFCKTNGIEYIDLSVFEHNLPARKLYSNFGFTEIVTFVDIIRMNGKSINDVQMVLKL